MQNKSIDESTTLETLHVYLDNIFKELQMGMYFIVISVEDHLLHKMQSRLISIYEYKSGNLHFQKLKVTSQ